MSESNKMNIWEKLQTMRCMLQDMCIKKSGENRFAGYKYYELGDFLPHINNLLMEYKAIAQVTFNKEEAKLTIRNCENPDEVIEFASPMAEANLKGAHAIQNLGAVETYQRRYLYMTAFEIVESDALDATQGNGQQDGKPQTGHKKAGLSEGVSKYLNQQITEYKKLTGKTMVTKMLEDAIKKPLTEVTDDDAKQIGKILAQWKKEYLEDK